VTRILLKIFAQIIDKTTVEVDFQEKLKILFSLY